MAAVPSGAAAHAFAERYDLPLPLGFFLAWAGGAVALSFLGSFVFLRGEPGRRLEWRLAVPPALARATRGVLGALALLLLAAVFATGLFGPAAPTDNFATVFSWVIWWVGFTLFTALAVDLWSPADPFGRIVGLVLRMAGRSPRARRLPAAASWLAVAGLLAISWVELISDLGEDPRALTGLVAVYCALLLTGAWAFEREGWFAAADPLSRLFGLLGRMAPVAAIPRGLCLRPPGAGLVGLAPGTADAVFIVTLIAVVLFDGLSETPAWAMLLEWITRSPELRPWLLSARGAGVDLMKLILSVGLGATLLVSLLLYAALSGAMARAAGGTVPAGVVFRRFAGSLLPIAVAYHLAHYVSYLLLAGQLVLPILSDPFGLGWDLFGTASRQIDLGVIDAEGVWWVAAIALVAGHALSVLVAHAEALNLYGARGPAIRSQIPMMAFMVALTSLSLWILAQPIVA